MLASIQAEVDAQTDAEQNMETGMGIFAQVDDRQWMVECLG